MGPYPKPGQPWAISTRARLTTGRQGPRCPTIPLSQGDEDTATPILLANGCRFRMCPDLGEVGLPDYAWSPDWIN